MVDFKKKLGKRKIEKKINPIEIYDSLDRRSETGPLRPSQDFILKEWYNKRTDDKDLIVKLHTGEGKTLIGLLILQSQLNKTKLPALYICPNKYLAQQVILEARKFGIGYCQINEDNTLPNEFLDGEKILITYVQKVFNGKTIFGLDNKSIHVDSVVIDDSHACIDSIKDAFSISFDKEHNFYQFILEIFEEDIKSQGAGSFLEIKAGDYDTFLPVPYWSLLEKRDLILQEISKYREEIIFNWPFIKDNIDNFQIFISGNKIELSPYYIPIHHFGTFDKASHRILMSATTQNDSFFIKGLNFSKDSVKTPLTNPSQKWSGEKMILIPSLIDDSLNRNDVVNIFAKENDKLRFGIVFLVNSFKKAHLHKAIGSIVADSSSIYNLVIRLKKGYYKNPVVFVNRYDGIDLPDESCRILIFDSLPYFDSLYDKYEEACRLKSDIINTKIAQKIEQGIGRSVRGEKDYSAIIIIGNDLVRFIKSSKTNKYFSNQTQKQVEIGIEIAKMAQEDIESGTSPEKALISLLTQLLKRDDGWKEYYVKEMSNAQAYNPEENLYDILEVEHEAEKYYYLENYEKACELMQQLIDDKIKSNDEKGWYLQQLARYKYRLSKVDHNAIQKSAFEKNRQLLKPKDGITYKRLQFINENRIRRIKNWINQFPTYEDLIINIDGVLGDLSFGTESERFEKALYEVGLMLGFLSERPDKEYKKGPDNLWCGIDNHYFVFECKSEINNTRQEINKHEAGQMNSHCGWFEEEYGKDVNVTYILVIHAKTLSSSANFTHPVRILRKGKLRNLRNNIKSFFKELKNYKINDISDEKLQEFINIHKLDIESLKNDYNEDYYHKK